LACEDKHARSGNFHNSAGGLTIALSIVKMSSSVVPVVTPYTVCAYSGSPVSPTTSGFGSNL
jgi:hypothetical protein